MPNRYTGNSKYKYGYQGSEKDDEVHGTKGTSYTTHFRQLDVRIGRWLSIDPLESKYPEYSGYNVNLNSPITLTDPRGDDVVLRGWKGKDRRWQIAHLKRITGLNISWNRATGELSYQTDVNGSPVINQPNSRSIVYSVTARNRLITMIDDKSEVIHVSGSSKRPTGFEGAMDMGDERRHTFTNINPDEVRQILAGYNGNKLTTNSGMIFFHETDHAYTGSLDEFNIGNPILFGLWSGDERAGLGVFNGDGVTRWGGAANGQGSATSFTNIIRREMGLRVRIAYSIASGIFRFIPFARANSSPQRNRVIINSYKTGRKSGIGKRVRIRVGNVPQQLPQPDGTINPPQRDHEANPGNN